ncbi:hypothetical protein CEUSTIGMA_g3247.t1 [Chlamydomonas eustigma]|uniref:Uncharacterized protein n=1 Tax=Chlamydomonas eustigma TaxID=1157962 RepID=A0A250WY83_9CHLO|nr:hypothetical protein CEUSTIGMA_g3247.t1 [Chlamydomonas eustigma]|eukprot:GAX75804.1 hypothetical protein CEUSTIGMA_g3247.t1 [Chlamydomonas eustigma]
MVPKPADLKGDLMLAPTSLPVTSPSPYTKVLCKETYSLLETEDVKETRLAGLEKGQTKETIDDGMLLNESSSLGGAATLGKWVVTSGGGLWEFKIGNGGGGVASVSSQRPSPSQKLTAESIISGVPHTDSTAETPHDMFPTALPSSNAITEALGSIAATHAGAAPASSPTIVMPSVVDLQLRACLQLFDTGCASGLIPSCVQETLSETDAQLPSQGTFSLAACNMDMAAGVVKEDARITPARITPARGRSKRRGSSGSGERLVRGSGSGECLVRGTSESGQRQIWREQSVQGSVYPFPSHPILMVKDCDGPLFNREGWKELSVQVPESQVKALTAVIQAYLQGCQCKPHGEGAEKLDEIGMQVVQNEMIMPVICTPARRDWTDAVRAGSYSQSPTAAAVQLSEDVVPDSSMHFSLKTRATVHDMVQAWSKDTVKQQKQQEQNLEV